MVPNRGSFLSEWGNKTYLPLYHAARMNSLLQQEKEKLTEIHWKKNNPVEGTVDYIPKRSGKDERNAGNQNNMRLIFNEMIQVPANSTNCKNPEE